MASETHNPYAPVPFEGPHSDDDLALFGPYRQLLPIEVLGERFVVPEDNTVLRALQYISLHSGRLRLPWHTYCWNNQNGCCAVRVCSQADAPPREGRACAIKVRAGMQLIELPTGGILCPPAQ